MNDNRPIGIFDSGVGGLTVAREIKKWMPNESIIYYGDAKHLPYGNKSPEVIQQFSKNITQFLLEQDCKLIVVACNTASSNALEEIKELALSKGVQVVDVITPVAEKVGYGFHQKLGVIATKATVDSGVYKKRIRKFNRHIKVQELATPLLVPVIEEGLLNSEISKSVVTHYLSNRKLEGIDSIILGCTHYPLIEKEVYDFFEKKVQLINSPLVVAESVKNLLIKEDLTANNSAEYRFFVSDITRNFTTLAKKFFSRSIELELRKLH